MRPPPASIAFLVLILPHLISAASANYGSPRKEAPAGDDEGLNMHHYARSCPSFEAIVGSKIAHWHSVDPTLSPSILRLLYFDCAIRGCDGSILLNNTGGERNSPAAATLRGFEVIDDIKAELERRCPRTVSCADILVGAARDATHKIGGPYWENVYGRKDGKISIAEDALAIPKGHESVTDLILFFESLGLEILDLVVLSGAHTVGRATCRDIQDRLYNHHGAAGKCDGSINPKFADYLKRKCWLSPPSTCVDLDATTLTKFDNAYYRNLKSGMGLLATDQLLAADSRTKPLVSALASQGNVFYHQFARSVKNLADTMVLQGDEGEVRTNCNFVNKY